MAKETNFEHPPKGHLALLAYDPVNDRWQAVHVDADGNLQIDVTAIVDGPVHLYGWDGDSWEKLQVDANKYLKVTLPIEEALGARQYQYDGSNWRRSNLLFGYNAVWDENLGGTAAAAGYTKGTSAIPAGEVWVLQGISIRNISRAITSLTVYLWMSSGGLVVMDDLRPAPVNSPCFATGQFVMTTGDVAFVEAQGCTAGDTIQAGVVGYKMKINM